jgi:hypothetical protein
MKDEILRRITQEQIYQYYFPGVISMRKKYINPLREEDKNPGAEFKYMGDTLMFVDFANNPTHVDCFKFIQDYHKLSFWDTLTQISKNFNLGVHKITTLFEVNEPLLSNPSKIEIHLEKEIKKETVIKVINRAFTAFDYDYWYQFKIMPTTLEYFNVRAVEESWIDGFLYHRYSIKDPSYRYREKDAFKIYRPLANKRYKWRTNMSGGILEGWEQLPKDGEKLFITKSRKDMMTLYEAGLPAVAVKAESVIVSENAAKLLSNRFENIYSFFDNDDTGKKFSEVQSEKYNWENIVIPDHFPKDPSDFAKKYSIRELLNLMNIII